MNRIVSKMPKVKSSFQSLVSSWSLDKKEFHVDGNILFCKFCEQVVSCTKKYHVIQHENTQKHKLNKEKQQGPIQTLLTSGPNQRVPNEFFLDLSKAFLSANIPWNKLENKAFSSFLEKYCKRSVPDESTLRKNYMPICYETAISEIKQSVYGHDVYLVVDETTDVKGRYVANLLIGKLTDQEPGQPHLLAVSFLDKTNHATIARFVNESVGIIYNVSEAKNKVKILYTDAAAYMKKAASCLKVFYPHMLHITCLAHALNRVCEVVRLEYPAINDLISNVKKIFLKAPLRIQFYKNKNSNLPLPPEPVITRWGTWLEAAFFYNKNFEDIKSIVMDLDASDAQSIRIAQQCFKEKSVQRDLTYIATNFRVLVESITKIETFGQTLDYYLTIIEEVKTKLNSAWGAVGQKSYKKLNSVLESNTDLNVLIKINNVLTNKIDLDQELLNLVDMDSLKNYKFAPTTSCSVERSFSSYKLLLSDRRQNLTEANIEKSLVCNVYFNNKK